MARLVSKRTMPGLAIEGFSMTTIGDPWPGNLLRAGRATKRCMADSRAMAATETFALEGHIVDSLILPKVLDLIVEAGVDYRLDDVEIGRTQPRPEPGRHRGRRHPTRPRSTRCASSSRSTAPARSTTRTPRSSPADRDGVLPAGFHSTTNLATDVRIDGHWVAGREPGDGLRPGASSTRRRRRRCAPRPCTAWSSRRPGRGRARRRPGAPARRATATCAPSSS